MYKAFINDKPLIIDDIYGATASGKNDFLILSDSEFNFDDVLAKIGEDKISGVLYLSANPLQAWHKFTDRYVLMEGAGGVVKNKHDEILVIYRKNCWDLPKGKLDYDESPEAAAMREVKEECGIRDIEIVGELTKTFHTYSEKNKLILKKTHWYRMTSADEGELIPQAEENIEKAKWMNKKKVQEKVFSNTYNSIRDVIRKYFDDQEMGS